METDVVFHVSTETDRERVDRNSVGRQESEILDRARRGSIRWAHTMIYWFWETEKSDVSCEGDSFEV